MPLAPGDSICKASPDVRRTATRAVEPGVENRPAVYDDWAPGEGGRVIDDLNSRGDSSPFRRWEPSGAAAFCNSYARGLRADHGRIRRDYSRRRPLDG